MRNLPGKLLFHIANIVKDYQMVDSVKHFLPKWASQYHLVETSLSTIYTRELSPEERMFVAYVSGRETYFVNLCAELMRMLDLVDEVFRRGCKSIADMNKTFSELKIEVLPPGFCPKSAWSSLL